MTTPQASTSIHTPFKATFFDQQEGDKNKILKVLETGDAFGKVTTALTDPKNHITIIFHDGCPDGSWSGEISSKLLTGRDITALSQKYPTAAPEKMVGLLKQHQAISDKKPSVLMTADTLFDMPLVLELLKNDKNITIINNDHHGGSGKKLLNEYQNLHQDQKGIIDSAITKGKLIVAINTEESGASQTWKLLSQSKSNDELKTLFEMSDKDLACYTQFMRAWDLTSMQPKAVEEFTTWADEHVELNTITKESLKNTSENIDNKFIKKNILHYALAYAGDNQFNSRYHHYDPKSHLRSDSKFSNREPVAPSYFDNQDPSYSSLPKGVLMKRPEETERFVADIVNQFKDFNAALSRFAAEPFIHEVEKASQLVTQGKKVQLGKETFLAVNAESRAGRFVQALVSDRLEKEPDCPYAVLFKNKYNVSLTRGLESRLDLTETVKAWRDDKLIHSGGGHPEAVGMQLTDEGQYKALLEKCSKAGITLDGNQRKALTNN